jgi:hypothetical protein
MSKWTRYEREPSNVGEPQSVRDAWDMTLQAQAEAAALISGDIDEIEIN